MYPARKPVHFFSYLSYFSVFFSLIGNVFFIIASFLVAYVLTLLPASLWSLPLFYTYELRLPAPFDGLNHVDWLNVFSLLKPQWTLLLVIYWSLARPYIMGIVFAWLVGLGLDVLRVGLIGEYALVFSIVCYLTLRIRRHLLYFHVVQQMVVVLGLLLIGQFLVFWIQAMIGHPPYHSSYWLSSVGGALLWPLLVWMLPKPEQ